MEATLPAPAERFLRSLTKALWTVPSDERDSILLELRGHLAGRAAQGPQALDAALEALGAPECLARQFDQGGGSLAAVPDSFAAPARALRTGEVAAEVRSTLRASRHGFVLVGALFVTTLTATDFLSWVSVRLPEVGISAAGVTAARVVAVLLGFCAGYRLALSPDAPMWRVDRDSLAFSAGFVTISVASIAGTVLLARAAAAALQSGGVGGSALLAAKLVVAIVSLAAFSAVFLRAQPWLAALAAGRRGFTLADSWRGTRGRMANIFKGWAALVLPLYLAHFALSLVALETLGVGPATLALAGIDGVVSAGAAIAAILLNATAFRWAAGEPIPAPRPFGSERPDEDLVEQARVRLHPLLQRRLRQPVSAE
jgi:hypothetical protein